MFTYQCMCCACDRPLKNVTIQLAKPLQTGGSQYTDATYMCQDCYACVSQGDAIIRETERVSKSVVKTTGVSVFVPFVGRSKEEQQFWLDANVLPHSITTMDVEEVDKLVAGAKSRGFFAHPLIHIIRPDIPAYRQDPSSFSTR